MKLNPCNFDHDLSLVQNDLDSPEIKIENLKIRKSVNQTVTMTSVLLSIAS